jgi:hypothetical protein
MKSSKVIIMVMPWATPTMAKASALILSDSVSTCPTRSVVKAFIVPPSADGGRKMFLCVYLLSVGQTLAKTKVLVSKVRRTRKTTDVIAKPDSKAKIAKTTSTNACPNPAKTDPIASMGLMITLANALPGTREKTARSTSTSAHLSRAKTALFASI